MPRASGSSALAALTKISLARVRNSLANNKSCVSAIIALHLLFRRKRDQSLSHRLSVPVMPKDRPSCRILTPAPIGGLVGGKQTRSRGHAARRPCADFNAEHCV